MDRTHPKEDGMDGGEMSKTVRVPHEEGVERLYGELGLQKRSVGHAKKSLVECGD
jgi:hypothetical protein